MQKIKYNLLIKTLLKTVSSKKNLAVIFLKWCNDNQIKPHKELFDKAIEDTLQEYNKVA